MRSVFRLSLLLLLTGNAAAAESPVSARLIVEARAIDESVSGFGSGASIRLRRASATAPDLVIEPGDAPSVEIELEPGTTWEIVLEARERWAPRTVTTLGEADSSTRVRLPVWPVRPVTGRLTLVPNQEQTEPPEPLRRLEARIEMGRGPGARRSGPRSTGFIDCPLADDGRFTCSLPVAELDLRMMVQGYVPHYRWSFEVPATEPVSLGTVKLEPGASVSGRVQADGVDLTKIHVSLVPATAAGSAMATGAMDKLASAGLSVAPDPSGFFQLRGVPAGAYLVEAVHPELAPARLPPMKVAPRTEVVLPTPIVLRPPLDLSLTIDPPVDWNAEPWHVTIRRAFDMAARRQDEAVYRGPMMQGEPLVLPNQAPGLYYVSISRQRQETVHLERFDVQHDADANWRIDLDLLRVEGRATLGDEPLQGTLRFSGREGASGIELTADEDGSFSGVLPGPGIWDVRVDSTEQAVHHVTRIEIDEDAESPHEIRLEIPDTLLFGRVVDETGAAVEASVMIETRQGSYDVMTDEQGEIELRGVPEGAAALFATAQSTDGELRSDDVSVIVDEGQPAGPIVLELRRLSSLAGRVFSLDGPIAGANVLALPPPGMFSFGARAQTDLNGGFELEIPSRVQRFHVVVSPPGHALKTFEIDTGYGDAIALRVPRETGTLELRMPMDERVFRQQGLNLLIEQNGISLPMGLLYPWAMSHGGRVSGSPEMTFPAMAPGHYRVCILADTAQAQSCAAGYLDSFQTLALEMKAPG